MFQFKFSYDFENLMTKQIIIDAISSTKDDITIL
jgi:hypothetical protein